MQHPRRIAMRTRRAVRRTKDRVLGKQPVHLLHIGKTGGSAVKHAVDRFPSDPAYSVYTHQHNVTLRQVPPGEKVVFFLRDPASRFVSGFYSRQRMGRPRYSVDWSSDERFAFETFGTANELAIALSSDRPDERAKAERAMRGIMHVSDSYWNWFDNPQYFESRRDDILFIGFQESLSEDFETLKTLLGMPDEASLPTDDVTSHRNPADVDRTLTDNAAANLRDWYRRDYEFVATCSDLVQQGWPGVSS